MGIDRNLSSRKKRGVRVQMDRAPKLVENAKNTMFLNTNKMNMTIKSTLSDLHALKKPLSVYLKKKNKIQPFTDATSLEFLSQRNDCSMFCLGSTSKKRPNNLVLGRMYDYKLLDMVEFGVEEYQKMTSDVRIMNQYGSKPILLFHGQEFVNSEKYKQLKSFFIDFFKGVDVSQINLGGVDHVISFTAVNGAIHFKHYLVQMKKKSHRGCEIGLKDIGPTLKLTLRRSKYASEDLAKLARRKPQVFMKSKKRIKSITRNPLGEKIGRVHVKQQPIQEISLRKFNKKKFKRKKRKKLSK